jgi:hypothetical protein
LKTTDKENDFMTAATLISHSPTQAETPAPAANAPMISRPRNIKGANTGIEIGNWSDGAYLQELIEKAAVADR